MRDKGLCYNCDEPYTFGHRCKKMQVYVLNAEEGSESEESQLVTKEVNSGNQEGTEQEGEPSISLHALYGYILFQTLVLHGQSKKVHIRILVDSGSTHNFLDPQTAKQIGCHVVNTSKLFAMW